MALSSEPITGLHVGHLVLDTVGNGILSGNKETNVENTYVFAGNCIIEICKSPPYYIENWNTKVILREHKTLHKLSAYLWSNNKTIKWYNVNGLKLHNSTFAKEKIVEQNITYKWRI